jgi:hypothetical protein
LKRRKHASGITIYLTEEIADARLRCNQLKEYINEAVELIEKSDKREHFFEVAGHLLHGIPDTLLRVESSLSAAAMAVFKWDYEEAKQELRPEKAEQLEDALKDVRTRRVKRRSSNTELTTMKTHEAAQELDRLARSIDETGSIDTDAIMSLVASLESNGGRIASSKSDVAGVLRELAGSLQTGKSRPSRAVLASALRRVLAETLDVGAAVPPPLPGPGLTPYSMEDGFENIRLAAVSAQRRGSNNMRLAFIDLASVIREIGFLCESLGSTTVPDLALRMSKAVIQSRKLVTQDLMQSIASSEKTAANLAVTHMLKSFAEGSQFGGLEVNDIQGAADRLEASAMKAAKLAFQYHLDTPPTNLFKVIADRVHDLSFYMGVSISESSGADIGESELAAPMSQVSAADKTAGAAPIVVQMVNAFREGAQFGEYGVRDVRGAALRVGLAAKAAVKYATSPNALSIKMPIRVFTELSERLYDLGFYIGSASASVAKTARFEEGKPADPTEQMDEADADKWKTEHDKNKDKFKEASYLVPKMKYAEEERLSRFEEGKPADPTENMSEQDADTWKTEHDNNKDKFKEASAIWKA